MEIKKVALVGNPNAGKTSLFNLLTGMHQHVGNFPGITVDKKTGICDLNSARSLEVLDLPGTYSIFPRQRDERVVLDVLSHKDNPNHPDLVIAVADASNLERNLFLFTQVMDLGLPSLLVLTMPDMAHEQTIAIDTNALSHSLGGIPVVVVNGRTGEGVEELKTAIANYTSASGKRLLNPQLHTLAHDRKAQLNDARQRYAFIRNLLQRIQTRDAAPANENQRRLDRWLVHPVIGYVLFIGLLLLIFQLVFHIAAWPMDWIDGVFVQLSRWLGTNLPQGVFTGLLTEGVVPGLGGVLVFIPQIAILFTCIALLEESGYMARVVFIMDRLVRPFGLSGKSLVPLLGSAACAIPGIMATRGISSWKERMITIMVAPLMSCSARIPVFMLIIALIVPEHFILGIFSLKGVVLFGLYTLGLVSALLVALVFKALLKEGEKSFLIMEMPAYRWPQWREVGLVVFEKVRVFVVDAGKVILAISVVLWALASYGPAQRQAMAADKVRSTYATAPPEEMEQHLRAAQLENSYIGMLGQFIEPVIKPLGYDWKIGIALITSFAAREVFVGSMATIYSVGQVDENTLPLLERLKAERDLQTGRPVYNLASGASLMVFYVFAMQCMATFAVVKRETRSIRWPMYQVIYMGILAYVMAFITYQLLA